MESPRQTLSELRVLYYRKIQEVKDIDKQIEILERRIQQACDHVWEYDDSDRGGRSRYVCVKCNKYR